MTRHGLLLGTVGLVLCAGPGCVRSFDDDGEDALKVSPGLVAVVRTTELPPGDDCAEGGVRIESGLDGDGDGVLDDDEVQGDPAFACHGASGTPAPARLVRVRAEPAGDGCATGGSRVESGDDDDGDGLLDDEEVQETARVCNGLAGPGGAALVEVTRVGADPSCAGAAQLLRAGLDSDGDGDLDPDEVAFAQVLCDGPPGQDGPAGADGRPALVEVSPEGRGASCPAGGQRVDIGLDDDRDGVLDSEEVTETAFVCHGDDGQGGGVPAGGVSEGLANAPAPLAPGRFDGGGAPRGASVEALGTSFYTFTTLESPAAVLDARYTIALFGVDTVVDVAVYDSADFASGQLPVTCRSSAGVLACATPILVEGQSYYLAITSLEARGDVFGLTVSLGADEGDAAVPVDTATRSVPLADGFSFPASVRGGGESHYALTPATDGVFTVALEGVAARPGQSPGLSWELYDDGAGPDALAVCPGACPPPLLVGGHSYRLRLLEVGGEGAQLTASFRRGDHLTEALPLDTVTSRPGSTVDPVFLQLTVPTDGDYTIQAHVFITDTWVYPDWFLFEDPWAVASFTTVFECYSQGCVVPGLVAGKTYYLRVDPYTSDTVDISLLLSSVAGADGLDGAPATATVGGAQAGSITDAANSYYSFVATAGGRYTARVDALAGGEIDCRFFNDVSFSDPLSGYFYGENGHVACVSEPVPPGTTVYLGVYGYNAAVYDLTIEEGDTVSTPLTVGGGPVRLVVEDYDGVTLHFPTAGRPYRVRFSDAVASWSATLHRKHPVTAGSASIEECTQRVADCHVDGFIAEGVGGYVRLRNRSFGRNEVTVELVETPLVDVTLGATLAAETLGPKDVTWYRFTAATDGFHTATVTTVSRFGYRYRLFDEDGIAANGGGLSSNSGTGSTIVHSLKDSITPLTAGTYLFRLEEEDGFHMTYDLVIAGP